MGKDARAFSKLSRLLGKKDIGFFSCDIGFFTLIHVPGKLSRVFFLLSRLLGKLDI
ncbi:MAG TPA: hypothetical protein VK014_09600 [Cyclobacteriaceae bacterium]|nr:hypothetical protein [Cyclobacteriaceae bacterium]